LLGDTGLIRAWYIEGPFAGIDDHSQVLADSRQSKRSDAGAIHETNKSGVLDFNERFGLHGEGSPQLRAKGTLEVGANVDGWLLVRADGWLTVTVDGTVKLRRTAPVGRARGWDALALNLSPGSHSVRLDCRRLNDRWTLMARFIDRTGHAPRDSVWRLPANSSGFNGNLEPFDVSLTLSAEPPVGLRVKIDAPLGTSAQAGSPLTMTLRGADGNGSASFSLGTWPSESSVSVPMVAQLGLLSEMIVQFQNQDRVLNLDVAAGAYHVRRKVDLPRDLVSAWQSIARQLEALRERPASELDVLRASLLSAQNELTSAATEDKPSYEIRRISAQAKWLSETITKAQVPWTEPGIHDFAWLSSADASIQTFALHVPRTTAADGPQPLVLVLHGYNGTPRSILDAFLDTAPGQQPRQLPGFVLAPAAHGNAFYRGPGERDVLEVLDWALRTLPIDKNRVTITGASMGGTGTAEIALHYPDHFAAQAPLCGYQSYYVRRDTSGQPLRAWEKKLMHRDSAASSADSGRYLPMYLAHGLKDRPLENSRVLTTRYKALGYKLIEDWPNLGHAVWKKTWAHAGLFPWLSGQLRAVDPPKITIASTTLRHAQSHWLNVLELDSLAELSTIDAEVVAPDSIHVVSKGVIAFAIGDTRHIDRNKPLQLQIDGEKLTAAPKSNLNFERVEGHWSQGEIPTTKRKVLGTEGPWLDLWSEPLVFVYGTGDPASIGVNLEVARTFASPQGGNDVAYPVLSDVAYLSDIRGDRVPVLVGNSKDNALLAKWADRLPLSTDERTIRFGGRTFEGDKLGAIFVYPNPEAEHRLIGVVTAPTPEGLWQSLSLPMLLPDFMVFDSRVNPAGGEPILGRRGRVLAAGFFNNDWSVPSKLNDALDENPALR